MSEDSEGKADFLPIENFSVARYSELVVGLDSLGGKKKVCMLKDIPTVNRK